MSARSPSFSVVIPIGPDERELDRLDDLLDSLRAHTPHGEARVVLIDDCKRPRPLHALCEGAVVVRTALWARGAPDRESAMKAGMIEALKHADGEFAVKLDTDALVIGPFVEAIRSRFAGDRALGLVGAFDRSPGGDLRDWSCWERAILRTTSRVSSSSPRAGGMPRIGIRLGPERAAARRVLAAARDNPTYTLGAHCLGGAYAVSAALLAHARAWDWRPWVRTGLSEDVTLGLLCGAAGLRMGGMVGDLEPFGVAWKGLPAPPDELVRRGYGIVHSIKDGRYGDEQELRRWFRVHTR